MTPNLLVLVGLRAEAQRLPAGARALISGGDPARAAALLVATDPQDISAVLSFGIAGALVRGLTPGDLVVAHDIHGVPATDPHWATALAAACRARHGVIAGSAAVAATPHAKRALHEATGAIAVDLESEAAARYAARHALPFAALRAIADTAEDTIPQAALAGLKPDGTPDIAAVLKSLARRPTDLPALITVARRARAALKALDSAVKSLRGDWRLPLLLLVVLGHCLLDMA